MFSGSGDVLGVVSDAVVVIAEGWFTGFGPAVGSGVKVVVSGVECRFRLCGRLWNGGYPLGVVTVAVLLLVRWWDRCLSFTFNCGLPLVLLGSSFCFGLSGLRVPGALCWEF